PMVVLNKIDRPNARPNEVVDEVLDLFIELGADDDQLEFPVVYASALNGTSGYEPEAQEETMDPVFQTILEHIPAPEDNREGPLFFQVSVLGNNDYVGRIGIGRVGRGKIAVGQQVVVMIKDGKEKAFRITKLFGFSGLKRTDIQEAKAGDIVAISGI